MRPAIFVFSQRHDVHADCLCDAVSAKGGNIFRINSEDIVDLIVQYKNEDFVFEFGDVCVPASAVSAVFLRRKPNSQDFGIHASGAEVETEQYILMQKEAIFLDAFFRLHMSSRFYNTIDSIMRYSGKGTQERIANQVGMRTNLTQIGGRDTDVIQFINRVRSAGLRVCTKALSGKYLNSNGETLTRYTELLPDNVDIYEENFESCPLIFQSYTEKIYEIRVTVIDQQICAILIDSQKANGGTKVDWRKYNVPQTPHVEYELPKQLKEKILEFHKIAGFRFSAFDFIRDREENYVFLETNPSGQWLWLENITGVPITNMIAEALCISL